MIGEEERRYMESDVAAQLQMEKIEQERCEMSQ